MKKVMFLISLIFLFSCVVPGVQAAKKEMESEKDKFEYDFNVFQLPKEFTVLIITGDSGCTLRWRHGPYWIDKKTKTVVLFECKERRL